ncbi:carbohydrate sulfotransferase 14-like isoform X1 [Amphiura filiformis]|uniref:carbohydrate sulfotransferase 14-like isoform X1 n=1 Tax=Amphiura filiformis TaxID=82378 RepID=UPI003B21BEA3
MVAIHRCILSCFLCCVSAVIFLLGGSGLIYQPDISSGIRVRTYREQEACMKRNCTQNSTDSRRRSRFRNRHSEYTQEIISGIQQAFGTTPEPDQKDLEITRSIRNETYRTVCAADDIQSPRDLTYEQREKLFSQIIVDDERKFLYCFVPKVACSNWKRVIKYMQGSLDNIEKQIKMDHKADLVFLKELSYHEIQYRLSNYYKFMFVRNPMERLLSAFRNKFGEDIGNYRKRYGPTIAKRYRQGKNNSGNYDDITFEEFIRLVVDTDDVNRMDPHWRPMHELCQPCAVHYDFIGSFEHLQYDAQYVLEQIRGDSDAYFPKRQMYYDPTTRDKIETELGRIKPEYLQQLIDKYILDFITFGYAPPKKHKYQGNVFYSPSSP